MKWPWHKRNAELDEELRAHLDAAIRERIERGESPAEAERNARREFGSLALVKEITREFWGGASVDHLLQDLRYAVRALRRNPGFAIVAVLTLALGIGVNTTLFTVFDAVALKPLPVRDPGNLWRLVRTFKSNAQGDNQFAFSYPEYVNFRDHADVLGSAIAVSWFTRVAAVLPSDSGVVSSSPREVETLRGQLVSANYFTDLGAAPVVGRTLLASGPNSRDTTPEIVLSYAFWQRRFHADPEVVGKFVTLNATQFAIVGVAPQDFIGTANPPLVTDFWAPLSMQPALVPGDDWFDRPANHTVQLLVRLKAGVPLESAKAELAVLGRQFIEAHPPEPDPTLAFSLQPATYFGTTDDWRFRMFTALLMVLVGMVLLVACANLANMLLARAAGRSREIAVRRALGAGRARLVRQLLTESALLALLGGLVGLFLSLWASESFWLALAPVVQGMFGMDPSVLHMTPDLRIFLYTFLLSLVTGVVFGLSPALRTTRSDLTLALKAEGSSLGARFGHSSAGGILVGGQAAISMLFLIGAGILFHGLLGAQGANPGIETRKVFLVAFDRPGDRAKAGSLVRQVIERLQGSPEVESAALVDRPPFTGTWTPHILIERGTDPGLATDSLANYVSQGYFATVGIPLLRGRNFTPREAEVGAAVVVVSNSAARRFWPGLDPIGRRLKLDRNFHGDWVELEIIGVAGDVRTANLSRPDPSFLYLPTRAVDFYDYNVLVRLRADTPAVFVPVRAAIGRLDSRLTPGLGIIPLEAFLRVQRILPRALALFSGILAFLALALSATGIYGVASFAVSQRTREIGVRMALGATPRDVLLLMLRQGLRPVVLGAAVGLLVSAGVSGLLHAILVFPGSPDFTFGQRLFDPILFVGFPGFLAAIAALACYVPARRATRVDPVVALRYE